MSRSTSFKLLELVLISSTFAVSAGCADGADGSVPAGGGSSDAGGTFASGGGFGETGGASAGNASSGGGSAGGATGGLGTGGASISGGGGDGGAAVGGGVSSTGGSPVGGTGAGGSSAGGNGGSGSYGGSGGSAVQVTPGLIAYMINTGCAGCHTPPAVPNLRPEDTVDTLSPILHETLTTYRVKECGDALLVAPGDPDSSALFMLLNGECTKDGKLFLMPETCGVTPCFPPDWMDAFTEWVLAGAPAE